MRPRRQDDRGREGLMRVASDLLCKAAAHVDNDVQRKVYQGLGQALSPDNFNQHLRQLLPQPLPDQPPPRKRLRNSEFIKIADLCKLHGKPQWALRPRTFVVLHMIGCVEAINDFVDENLSDIALPYSDSNLPQSLTGDARRRFLEYQDNVLTGQAGKLERPGGDHQHIKGSAEDLFMFVKALGTGAFGYVDHVVGRLSLNHFARKRISRGRLYGKDKEKIRMFENELGNLKALSHRHLVKLVGSYTDSDHVGLLMTPVASGNLADFLKGNMDPEDRRIRLRCFFGCMATAVEYLHENKIRHKDLKPQNVLVKDQKVFITDFGTSYNWADDDTDITQGTEKFYTPRYSAPEILLNASRNQAADIWSLGCVFFEMCAALCGLSVVDMKAFFTSHGTGGPNISNNLEATQAWTEYLHENLPIPQDAQPLKLARIMCNHDASKRPTAKEVVLQIFQFSSPPPYHGLCCDKVLYDRGSRTQGTSIDDYQDQTLTIGTFMAEPEEAPPPYMPGSSTYCPPCVEDAELTMQAMYQEPLRLETNLMEEVTMPLPAETSKSSEGLQEAVLAEDNVPPVIDTNTSLTAIAPRTEPAASKSPKTNHHGSRLDIQRILRSLDTSALPCPWPKCKPPKGLAIMLFDSPDSLNDHLRSAHNVHDFSWTRLLSDADVSAGQGRLLDLNNAKLVHVPKAPKSSLKSLNNGDLQAGKSARFGDLPEGLRPDTVSEDKGLRTDGPVFEQSIFADLPSQPFDSQQTGASDGNGAKMPASSLVPSYILASKNRFTSQELTSLLPRARLNGPLNSRPLFVYGTLMFPSILRARAESFVGLEGEYSSKMQRRLRTDTSDWSKINFSLQHAAEQMTPARLKGFRRYKCDGLSLAMLSSVKGSQEDHLVNGFVIFGLSLEAQLCLDHMYAKDGARYLFTSKGDKDDPGGKWTTQALSRELVKVSVGLAEGGVREIEAFTYVDPPFITFQNGSPEWSIDNFLRSKSFNKLTGDIFKSKLIEEEYRLAERMGMKLSLLGDELVEVIKRNDVESVERLLKTGSDVNAPCSVYGFPLQAAAHFGYEDIVWILIESGARVKAKGGQYETALIAAVVEGRENIAKLLIREGADIFAPGGRYISALYQAVEFDDVDMAHLLLEKGAWLTKDYGELLDLAEEHGNRDMVHELQDYDVRGLHRRPAAAVVTNSNYSATDIRRKDDPISSTQKSSHERRELMMANKSQIITSCLMKVWSLKGQRGKWTGIKGVELMKTAIQNGADEDILEQIRPHIGSFPRIQSFFSEFLNSKLAGQMKPVQHTDKDETSQDPSQGRSNGRPEATVRPPPNVPNSNTGSARPGLVPQEAIQSSTMNSRRPAERANGWPGRNSDDIICMTCDGRGGRRGTERPCADCKSSGKVWSASKGRAKTCRTCDGAGYTFSARDRCRACHGPTQ